MSHETCGRGYWIMRALNMRQPAHATTLWCTCRAHTPWSLMCADEEYGVNRMGVAPAETLRETAVWTAVSLGVLCVMCSSFLIALYRARQKARIVGERRALLRHATQ